MHQLQKFRVFLRIPAIHERVINDNHLRILGVGGGGRGEAVKYDSIKWVWGGGHSPLNKKKNWGGGGA